MINQKMKKGCRLAPLEIKEIVTTICNIVVTTIGILVYKNNSKIQKLELKIKQLEYQELKRKLKK